MHKTSKKLLSVLLTLAMVLSLLPGAALLAAADGVTYVQITSTPTAETLANMITYSQDAALAIYNSAEFQAGAGPNGGIVLIFDVGDMDGEYMVIHNAQGTPEVISMALDIIGMLLQYDFNVYIVQPGGSVTPPDPPAKPAVYYQYYTLNTADWSITPVVESTTNYTLVTSSSGNWKGGWWVVSEDVVIDRYVDLTGTVRLILCDGASLTVTGGIWASAEGSKLIIYPGVMDSGAKTAPTVEGSGTLYTSSQYSQEPGIGGTLELEIHGGVIEAAGGSGGAGIGGGYGGDGCDVTIYGGTVNAIGGENAAGIGGANGANGGDVTIYGGTVTAIGGENAAAIGAGANGSSDGELNFSGEEILLETSDDNVNWSTYAEGSPRGRYMRAQVQEEQPPAAVVSADEGFTEDFEGEIAWTFQNGEMTNAWVVGAAVNNGGSKALYISNDGGESNAYDNGQASFVFAEKLFSFEGETLYNFAYDWRCFGEGGWDFIRVALIPEAEALTPGSSSPSGFGTSTLPGGWIPLDGGTALSGQSDWQHASFEDVRVSAGVYRLAFIWRCDSSMGAQPPAAIDNFSVVPGDPYVPIPSIGSGCIDDFEGENTWILENGGRTNVWVVGEAVSNGGSKALYISNDGGESNAYTLSASSFVYAYKSFNFDAGYYNLSLDWRCYGESTYDFIRVALIPVAQPVAAGANYPTGFGASALPSGWIALDGGSKLNLQSEWQSFSKELIEVPAGEYRVAIIWRNDTSSGSLPPAAIDNFSLTPNNYTPVVEPVPADEGYTDDFEGVNTWTLQNGEQTNAWYVGDAVSNGGGKSLYVSKDGGFTNAYDVDSPSFVIAEKLFSFEGGYYDFAYDWRCGGEVNWDFLRVALVPEDEALTPGTDAPVGFSYDGSLPSGWIALDNGSQLATGDAPAWQQMSIEALEVPAGIYRVAFCWRNDDEIGSEIPAAIDNFSVMKSEESSGQTVDVYLIDQTNAEPSDVRIWAWGSAGNIAAEWSERPAMAYQGSDAVVNREGVNGDPYTAPYYLFSLDVDAYGDGLLFTNPNGQSANCALTAEQKEAGFAVFYLYYADNGLGASAGDDIWKLVDHSDANCTEPAVDFYEGLLTEAEDSIARGSALGHDWGDWTVTSEPTCTQEGEKTRECARCHETENETLDALGHNWSEWELTFEPSCTDAGEQQRECYVCGETETEPVEALGHDPMAAVVENNVEPSCTVAGGYEEVVYCDYCHAELSRTYVTVEALGHVEGSEAEENRTEPTCTDTGGYDLVVRCTRCQEILSSEHIEIPANGHTPGEAVIENEVDPTPGAAGSYDSVVYCTVCGAEMSRDTVRTLYDGFYLIGPGWTVNDIKPVNLFEEDPNVEGQYKLNVTLETGNQIKVVKVYNDAITGWYPDGYGTEYTVDADHAGSMTVYFRDTYNADWAAFGGYFFICESEPVITTQPEDMTVTLGQRATFTVEVFGDDLSYQWQYKRAGQDTWHNWTGRTSATLTFRGIGTNNDYQYRCVVTNAAGSVISEAATLTVLPKPVITTQPEDFTVALGQYATFTVEATGDELSYQWQYRKPGQELWCKWEGRTSATLTFRGTTFNNDYQYRCVVTNATGSVVRSEAATLTVIPKPVITTQPEDATVALGEYVTFTVEATGDDLSYQWQYQRAGKSTWYNWTGKTSATLSFRGTENNNDYHYRCVVTNVSGSVRSEAARLTVVASSNSVKPELS